ncbi:hypothetical protein ZWY2020_029472 [Hordeum vulgare]|nr:hypothetical protein ZWY2020_029472 [Hordeum vulgare]
MAPGSAAKRPKLEPSASASTSAAQHQYQRGDDDYVPGNIMEIEFCNFMTYDRLVCGPGPRLNLVVGPNGFGKSSLVCAITLVLVADPSIHGRASSVGLCPPEARDADRASDADHPGGGGGRGSRWKGASWLRAILPRRGARRRDAKEGEEEEPSRPSGALDPHPHPDDVGGGGLSPPLVERRASLPLLRGALLLPDPPRHSWDGSMVDRAFACSFACLDDLPDGVTRVRQSNEEELPVVWLQQRPGIGTVLPGGMASESRNGGIPPMWPGEGPRFIETRRCSDASRRETRRCKNGETTDIENGEIHHGRSNGSVLPGRASQSSSRSSQAAAVNRDTQNFRTDWLKNKECRIGRSRSVHYTSPGNFENGMLRFYLTPMRRNRIANRGRRRSSRLFGRGLFGFV